MPMSFGFSVRLGRFHKASLFRYGQPSSSPRGGGRGGGAGGGMPRGMMPNVSPFGGGRRPSTNASPQIQSPTVSQ